jgi:hypothetical protein
MTQLVAEYREAGIAQASFEQQNLEKEADNMEKSFLKE